MPYCTGIYLISISLSPHEQIASGEYVLPLLQCGQKITNNLNRHSNSIVMAFQAYSVIEPRTYLRHIRKRTNEEATKIPWHHCAE